MCIQITLKCDIKLCSGRMYFLMIFILLFFFSKYLLFAGAGFKFVLSQNTGPEEDKLGQCLGSVTIWKVHPVMRNCLWQT